jgi:pyruvate dehydrogenase E2 component (dihydrolipoamide acetyltransferase)
MRTFKLPDLGEGMLEAEIVEWHVREGDAVLVDQPLVAVETDKAIVEVPSPQAGRILRLYGKPHDVVHVGAPLVGFEGGDEADAGTVVGHMPVSRDVVIPEAAVGVAHGGPSVKAAPAVHRLGVDLALVTPSGPNGLVTVRDVQRVAKLLEESGPPETLRGVRRGMAQNMALAQREVAAATVIDDADIDAWPRGTDVTIRLVRSIVAGCRVAPQLNALYDRAAGARRVMKKIDVGIAVDTPDGLFVPVLRDVANRDTQDLRGGLDRMRADVVARRIPVEELRGYTITLSNFGMIGARYAAPIVMPPTVAILGAGRIRDQVVAAGGQPAVHRVLPLSLTFDHRVVTGGEAARFLNAVIADLEAAA